MKIVIGSSRNIVFEGVFSIIQKEVGVEVSDIVDDAESLLKSCRENQPEVVIVHSIWSDSSQLIPMIEAIQEASPHSGIVLMTSGNEFYTFYETHAAGAMAYLNPVDISADHLIQAVRNAAERKLYLSDATKTLFRAGSSNRSVMHEDGGKKLGEREMHVLSLLGAGNSSKKIAEILKISVSTVEVHRRNIMFKTGLHNIADLTRFAIRNQLISA